MDCVFCKIRDGQIPSVKIYDDEWTFAIMDINPLNAGHCLVILKNHAPTLFDADPADLAAAITAALQGSGAFGLIETFETLHRPWNIEGRSVRPALRMVAHTAFLTVARKLVTPVAVEPEVEG